MKDSNNLFRDRAKTTFRTGPGSGNSSPYVLKINTNAFLCREPPLKQRLKEQYLPKYWKKLNLDRKSIAPGDPDRLSFLSLKQIDRLIDMEKIKCSLNEKKLKKKPILIAGYTPSKGRHPNVYQANFLSRINKIAIDRNMRYLRDQQFDDFDRKLAAAKLKQTSSLSPSIKYQKSLKYSQNHIQKTQQSQQKSLPSIQQNIDEFQHRLQEKKCLKRSIRDNKIKKQQRLLNENRWYEGMSTYYLQLHDASAFQVSESNYVRCFDMEHLKYQ